MRMGSATALLFGSLVWTAAAAPSAPLAGEFSVDAHVLASGSSQLAANACFRLRNITAEPIAGYASSADFAIAAGFFAPRRRVSRDDIMFDSFEACPP